MKPYRILLLCVVSLAALAVLAACSGQGPASETLIPTIDLAGEPTGYPAGTTPGAAQPAQPAAEPLTQPTGYPAGSTPAAPAGEQPSGAQPAADPAVQATGYPAEQGPQGVPAVNNAAQITARLIEMAPSETNTSLTRLHVLVLSTSNVGGEQNFTSNLVNQEADIFSDTSLLPSDLAVGDTFSANVTYRGDEQTGLFLANNIQETAQ